MKKINFTIALLILVLSGYAQTSNCNDHALAYGKVISKEEMTVTGSCCVVGSYLPTIG